MSHIYPLLLNLLEPIPTTTQRFVWWCDEYIVVVGLCTTGIEQRERTNQPYHDEELEGKQQRGEHKREETSSKICSHNATLPAYSNHWLKIPQKYYAHPEWPQNQKLSNSHRRIAVVIIATFALIDKHCIGYGGIWYRISDFVELRSTGCENEHNCIIWTKICISLQSNQLHIQVCGALSSTYTEKYLSWFIKVNGGKDEELDCVVESSSKTFLPSSNQNSLEMKFREVLGLPLEKAAAMGLWVWSWSW